VLAMLPLAVLSASPTSIAITAFTHVGYDERLGAIYVDQFATMLGEEGFRVTTQKDLESVLGLERQRQMMGCGDDATSAACAAELAGALGTDIVVSGSIAKSGDAFLVSIRFLSKEGKPVAAGSTRVIGEVQLLEWLRGQARALAGQMNVMLDHAPVGGGLVRSSPVVLRWVPAIVGAAAVLGGAVSYGLSYSDRNIIAMSSNPVGEQGAIAEGQTRQDLGVSLMIVGGVFIAASIVWVLLTGRSP
jgi:hypothetical protein